MTLEERPCPICKTTARATVFRESTFDAARWTDASFSSRKLPEYMHFRLLKCATCGVAYGSPVPPAAVLDEAYRDASFEAGAESAYAARTYTGLLRKARIMPGRALDIGTGDGAFLRELRALGFSDVVGIEPSKAPVVSAQPDVRPFIRNELFDGTLFDEGTFDLVTCFQTIEHIYEPRQLLEDIHRVLKPGGKAVLVAHDLDAFSAKVLGDKSPIFDIEHVQLFNRPSLHFLLDKVGFRDIAVFSILNAYPVSYWVKLFPLPRGIKTTLLGALERGLLEALGRLTIPMPAGNLAVVGAKESPR